MPDDVATSVPELQTPEALGEYFQIPLSTWFDIKFFARLWRR